MESQAEAVPFLVIGDEYFVGYSEEVTPGEIERRVKECSLGGCPDSVGPIVGVTAVPPKEAKPPEPEQPKTVDSATATTTSAGAGKTEKMINLPFVGNVNALTFSLPLLTVIMGLLDGFNPCAMWTLLFLISLLLGMQDRKKMWLLGTAFIAASAAVYFMFMAAWLNLIILLGFMVWVRIALGLLALFGGGYSLKEYFTNKDNTCKVEESDNKQKIFERLKAVVQHNSLWLALGGIIALAFVVNLVELICSAGLPAVYTQVLAINELPGWQHYFYILLYIFFFMLDDMFVFIAAMVTLKLTGLTTKYTRMSRLIGGVLMLIIGLLLIFKPEWLILG